MYLITTRTNTDNELKVVPQYYLFLGNKIDVLNMPLIARQKAADVVGLSLDAVEAAVVVSVMASVVVMLLLVLLIMMMMRIVLMMVFILAVLRRCHRAGGDKRNQNNH